MVVSDLENYYSSNFNQLVKRMSSRCGNFHDAEDIVQTAFERSVKYFNSCNGGIDRWFSGILNNVFRDYQNMTRLGPVTKPLEEHLDDIEPIIPNDIHPIIKREIQKMVEREDEPNKTVLKLHLDFGFTNGEIKELVSDLTYRKIHDIISVFKRKVILRYK